MTAISRIVAHLIALSVTVLFAGAVVLAVQYPLYAFAIFIYAGMALALGSVYIGTLHLLGRVHF
jgi:hypothetical protein